MFSFALPCSVLVVIVYICIIIYSNLLSLEKLLLTAQEVNSVTSIYATVKGAAGLHPMLAR